MNNIFFTLNENDDAPAFYFLYKQRPENWFLKAACLYNDANILYAEFNKSRTFIINKLKERGFDFSYFYRYMLEAEIHKIIAENSNIMFSDFNSFYLLAAFAFENVFKGVYLSRNITKINSKRLAKELQTHNLVKLANISGLCFSEVELSMLASLSDAIAGEGRYPLKKLPSREAHLKLGVSFGGGCLRYVKNTYSKDKFIIDNIWDVLNSVMAEETKKSDENDIAIFKEKVSFF